MNHLKNVFRSLMRQKFSSFINILGLALGMGSFIIITIFVYTEMKYDRFHEKGDRIYRIVGNIFNPNSFSAALPLPFYPHLKEEVPELEEVVRVRGAFMPPELSTDSISISQSGVLFVDPEFLSVFSYGLLAGDLNAFGEDPNSILITSEVAERLFGSENPIGRTVRYYNAFNLVVRGVLEDVPEYSHLQFSALIPFEFQRSINTFPFVTWGNYSTTFYAQVSEGTDIPLLEEKIFSLFAGLRNIDFSDGQSRFILQPLRSIYLGSGNISSATVPVLSGNQSAVYIFSVSAVLILLLACLNYVNLTSAKSTMRAREVGVRKVLGAGVGSLVRKFLVESFFVSLFAMVIGIALVEISLPYFANFSGKDIGFFNIPISMRIAYLAGLLLLVTLLSGLYPAFILSRFKPVTVLKGSSALISRQLQGRSGPNFRMRQLMIIAQFAISTGLIIASLIMYGQTHHALKHSGFERESLMVVKNRAGGAMTQRYYAIRNELEKYPYIKQVSAGSHVPTQSLGLISDLRQPHQAIEERELVYIAYVDFGYFETLGINISCGRSFEQLNATDSSEVVILNRTAAKNLQIKEADGTLLTGFGEEQNRRVIGIIEDVHFRSVIEKVNPKAFIVRHTGGYQAPASNKILIRYESGYLGEVFNAVEMAWQNHAPEGNALDYFFMDNQYENLYRSELQMGKVALIFTILAILIAAMGLLGTTVYVMEARKKEMGVRKVLGATTARLSAMITKEFTILIVLANVVAWPLTFYFMSRWLGQFAYRMEVSIWIFLLAGLTGLLLALIIINSLVYRQAIRNPVESLKYE